MYNEKQRNESKTDQFFKEVVLVLGFVVASWLVTTGILDSVGLVNGLPEANSLGPVELGIGVLTILAIVKELRTSTLIK